jgi:hypothetical protein
VSERRGELEAHQERLRRELARRRRAVKARAYEDAIRRLKEAACDYAREIEPSEEGPAFYAGVLHALAAVPRMLNGDLPSPPRRIEGTPPPQIEGGARLDELVIGELLHPRWRGR